MTTPQIAHPPETLEGWYALHQIFRFASAKAQRDTTIDALVTLVESEADTATSRGDGSKSAGWSRVVRLIGSRADVMVVHFRETLDEIGQAQRTLACAEVSIAFDLLYSFLSVAEAGLYHITAELERTALERGGKVGDDEYLRDAAARSAAEKSNPHVARRLYPVPPTDMRYVCFYPMSKRRDAGQNWYTLALEERSRLMLAHGITGRRYAGRVQQIITGAIGLDAWEWGVTLFGRDPMDFKKLVTEMRFDEVSAKYAEFGDFYVGEILASRA